MAFRVAVQRSRFKNPGGENPKSVSTTLYLQIISLVIFLLLSLPALAADKLLGIHSARTMSQSMPWIAEEAGLFKKYDLEFQLVYISSASMVNAAMLSGSGDVAITGGESVIRTAIA
jgi:ABC-type nitrate/sulfonate/bicarbonate transport system substrate-binding protein